MDTAQLRALATQYTAAWCSQNASSVAAFFAEGGTLKITAAAQHFMTAFPDMVVTMNGISLNGEHAVYRWTMTGTHTGVLEFLGIPPTGRPVTMSGQEIFRAVDGRFAEVWHAEDVGAMMQALDLEPPRMILRLAARRSARKFKKEQRRK